MVVNQGLTVRQQTLYRLEVIRFSAFLFINDVKRNALQRKASAGARRVKQMRRGRICSQSGARSVKQDVWGTSCSPSGEQTCLRPGEICDCDMGVRAAPAPVVVADCVSFALTASGRAHSLRLPAPSLSASPTSLPLGRVFLLSHADPLRSPWVPRQTAKSPWSEGSPFYIRWRCALRIRNGHR